MLLPFSHRVLNPPALGLPSGQVRVTRQNALVFGSTRGTVRPKDLRTFDSQFMRHDWSESVMFTTHWQTAIEQSYDTLREEAQALKTRATHTIEARTLGWDQVESFQHFANALRSAQNQFPIPLYCDRAKLTGDPSSNFVPCDPIYRRFYVGQRVAMVRQDFQKTDVSSTQVFSEYALISDISSEGITLTDSLLSDWSTGDWIYPLIDCHPIVSMNGTLVTNHHLSTNIIATEQGGHSSLPPTFRNRVTHLWNYNGHRPVVDFNEWNAAPELSIEAKGGIRSTGKGSTSNIQGDFPLVKWTYAPLMETRRDAWELQNLFDSCRGRAMQFLLLSPLAGFIVQGFGSTFVDINPVDNLSTFTDGWVERIALDFGERQRIVKTITSATEINGGTAFRLSWEGSVDTSNTLLRAVVCHQVRFAEDSLTIEWLTDEISQAQFSIVEVRNSSGVAHILNKPNLYSSTSIEG